MNTRNKIFFLTTLLAFIIQLYFFNRGLVPYDEGYILHAGQRIADREIIYKDFQYNYTPGSAYLTALSFMFFGESVLSGRILMLIMGVISSFLIYKTIVKTTNKPLLAINAVFLYLSWGPTHINFPWPVMFSLLATFIVLYLLVVAVDKKSKRYYFWAGISSFFVLMFKQNLGVGVIAACIISFVFIHKGNTKTSKYLNYYFLGVGVIALLFLVQLSFTDSLVPFIYYFYFITIKVILLENQLGTPFFYGEGLLKLVKAIFYTLPLTVSSFVIIHSIIKKAGLEKYIFLSLIPLFFYLLGIRPTTDLMHLTPLLALMSIPLSLMIFQIKDLRIKLPASLFSLGLIGLGFYSAIFSGHYKWGTPIVQQNHYLSNDRVKVFVGDDYSSSIPLMISYIEELTEKDDYIYVQRLEPMYYFIFDRKNPTRFGGVGTGMLKGKPEYEALEDLKRSQPEIVIGQQYKDMDDRVITKYIKQNYVPYIQLGRNIILQRKK